MSRCVRKAASVAFAPLLDGIKLVNAVRETARDLSNPSLVRDHAHRMFMDCCDAGGCPDCQDADKAG